MKPDLTLALAGNPNSGKTTTFNLLTGSRQQVGNYPGVTVEKKEGFAKDNGDLIHVVDLPGTYSITAYSMEELAARDYLVQERPDAVVDVLDANTLERSLYLAIQLMELGAPLVLALNMMDEVRKRNMTIDVELLSSLMGCPVVETVAKHGEGREALLKSARHAAAEKKGKWEPLVISYSQDIDEALVSMVSMIEEKNFLLDKFPARWLALKFIEGDSQLREMGLAHDRETATKLMEIASEVEKHCKNTLDIHPEAVIADYRYGYIASLLRKGIITKDASSDRIAISDQVDRVVTNAIIGPILMLAILYGMFELTFAIGEVPMGWVDSFFSLLQDAASAILPAGKLRSLVVSGIIGGVGGVLGFVPLIVIMFMLLSFLEDLGYMSRMAYMLDKVFKIFGLHGCSVMPFIVSGGIPGGCAVPGVMAARTLRSPKERLATILTAPFMSCGAKVPVFILLVGAFFSKSAGLAMFWITLGGWAAALVVARILRSTIIQGPPTPFIMELPPYRMPTLRGVLIHTWERAWQYIKKAGTVILAISILLWALMTYPAPPEQVMDNLDSREQSISANWAIAKDQSLKDRYQTELDAIQAEKAEAGLKYSFAGRIGTAMEPVTSLAGFDWRTNIALVGGVAAKEVIVSTLGTAYSLGEVDPEESKPLSRMLASDPHFDYRVAISLIIFTLLYAPCSVTIVTMAKEASWKWAMFSLVFNTALAFALSVGVYQTLKLL